MSVSNRMSMRMVIRGWDDDRVMSYEDYHTTGAAESFRSGRGPVPIGLLSHF